MKCQNRHTGLFRTTMLLLSGILIFLSGKAEKVELSTFEKISSTMPYMRILGKNQMGTLIHRYGKKTDLIVAYDDELNVKWKKTISIKQQDADVVRCILLPDALWIFYKVRHKNHSMLYVRKATGDLEFGSSALLVDTLHDGRGEKVNIVKSKDKKNILAYSTYTGRSQQLVANLNLFDEAMNLQYKKQVTIAPKTFPLYLKKILISNHDKLFFIAMEREKGKKKNQKNDKTYLFTYDPENNSLNELDLSDENKRFIDITIAIDNINQQIILAGFYSTMTKDIANGMFYFIAHFDSMDHFKRHYQQFDASIIERLTGKEKEKRFTGLSTFKIRDIVLRHDGGAVLVAESEFVTTETRAAPGFYPSMFYSTVTYSYYHYNDIMVFSIHPDGTIHWDKILRKRQFSEGDDGFYSSFLLSFNRDKMHFIFNEEIGFNANVLDYSLSGLGEQEKAYLLTGVKEDLMLIPRLGKQISGNQLIIPSIYRNKLRLVKLTF